MLEILVPVFIIAYGCVLILGHHKKWKFFVDPKKSTANIFESGLYVSKSMVGDEAYKIGSYIGGVLTIFVGIFFLVVFNI